MFKELIKEITDVSSWNQYFQMSCRLEDEYERDNISFDEKSLLFSILEMVRLPGEV